MTQKDKDLLLKDLSARLPYGVFMQLNNKSAYRPAKLVSIDVEKQLYEIGTIHEVPFNFAYPYLFPLSSMTEEQSKEFALLQTDVHTSGFLFASDCSNMISWLNKNHFDYNGLIEKGLAIDCTNLNIY